MTLQEQYEQLEHSIRSYNPAADFTQIRAAFQYADQCHAGQKRKSGEPYIIHPLAVAQIVADQKLDSESIIAALLHDVIEDTAATHEDVARLFSPTIANLVEGVSKLTRIQYATKEDEQMENLRKMLFAMSKDIRVILIKISDRLHNMRTMEYQSPPKQKQKSLETMEIYAPIAHRLGMQRIKWELEDLSLKYLDPIGYEEIVSKLDAKKPEYEAFMKRTQIQIDQRLSEMGIQHVAYGRMKHPYSIYRKMFNQNKSLDEIFDLFAFRVIVENVGDCYNVLGVIHDIYKPILGRFKDYIGTPKPNGYQSLHTTVMGPDGYPFEVQIRTREMHEIAEYGVAAHWKYKQNGQGAGTEGRYEWVRRLLENQEGTDAEEYIHSLKVDMFADEVFVFKLDIDHIVYGRMKHPYSIYRKMFNQNKSLDEIFDLFAFRVVVENVGDCYNVLGVIHDIYKPILGRFKDYIGTPKPNGYQSLHTTVMGNDGYPFEVQIRTREMHEIAEYGVAAHWKYKQGGQGAGSEGRYEWVRRLLENQEGADAEEYIHSLKIDMFSDEVFVFTPNGDVQNLPAGATPIDFAYAIHSAVGNRMVGAKVNNRIVTLDHVLKNGDIVEILTAKNAKGPSRDWMKIAKSSEARSKIRQWFKKERKEENIANGRASFEAELKHCGLAMRDITDPEVLPGILKKVSYPSLEEMYAAIGYGGFSAQKAVSRMQGELQRLAKQHQLEQQTVEAAEPKPPREEPRSPAPKKIKSEQGIIVEGLNNCLVKFSKCCTPVPGDEIVGFITRGYGVSVHRADCPNASQEKRTAPDQAGRWIKVSWGSDTNESYPTILEALCKDRHNLLLDISAALSTTNTFVLGINTRSTEDGYAICRLEVRVRDGQQLTTLMNKLHQISGVLNVTRPAG